MATAHQSRADRAPAALFVGTVGLLLPVAFHPSLLAEAWTLRAVLLLLVIGVGLPRLVAQLRSDDRRVAVLAFAALAVTGLSTLAATRPALAFYGAYYWGTGWLFILVLASAWGLGASLDADGRRTLRNGLLAGILLNVPVAFAQAMLDTNVSPFTRFDGRAAGLAGNPIHLGALAAGALALLVVPMTERPRRWAPAVVALAATLQLSGSRAGLLVTAAVLLIAAWRHRRKAGALVAAAVVGLLLGTAVADVGGSSSGSGRLAATATSGGTTARLHTWWSARHAVADRPILGSGPGQFRGATSKYRDLAIARAEGPGRYYFDAHNLVVEYAVTTGLAGLVAMGAWLFAAVRRGRGPLLAFALAILATHLLEPQFVGTTPLAFLALGAATTPRVPRPPGRALHLATAGLVVVALLASARLVEGDFRFSQASLDFNDREARDTIRLFPPWPDPRELASRIEIYGAITRRDPQRLAEARQWAERAAAVDPTGVTPRTLLGDIAMRQRRFVAARAAYAEALERDPWSAEALIGLRDAARALQRTDEADRWEARLRQLRAHT